MNWYLTFFKARCDQVALEAIVSTRSWSKLGIVGFSLICGRYFFGVTMAQVVAVTTLLKMFLLWKYGADAADPLLEILRYFKTITGISFGVVLAMTLEQVSVYKSEEPIIVVM